jgi:hypothetical protein
MPRWETTVNLPDIRVDEVIEKLREIAYPTAIVVEVEAENLWKARGLMDECVQEINAMSGVGITVSNYVKQKGAK